MRGRLPWLAAALINATERANLPTSNFLLWKSKLMFSVAVRFCKISRRSTFVYFCLVCPPTKRYNTTCLCERKQIWKPVKQNNKQQNNSAIKIVFYCLVAGAAELGCSFSHAAASSAPRSRLCLPSRFFLARLRHGYLKSCRCVPRSFYLLFAVHVFLQGRAEVSTTRFPLAHSVEGGTM